jgi:hypothetical protein
MSSTPFADILAKAKGDGTQTTMFGGSSRAGKKMKAREDAGQMTMFGDMVAAATEAKAPKPASGHVPRAPNPGPKEPTPGEKHSKRAATHRAQAAHHEREGAAARVSGESTSAMPRSRHFHAAHQHSQAASANETAARSHGRGSKEAYVATSDAKAASGRADLASSRAPGGSVGRHGEPGGRGDGAAEAKIKEAAGRLARAKTKAAATLNDRPPSGYYAAKRSKKGGFTDGQGNYWYPGKGTAKAGEHAGAHGLDSAEAHHSTASVSHAELAAHHRDASSDRNRSVEARGLHKMAHDAHHEAATAHGTAASRAEASDRDRLDDARDHAKGRGAAGAMAGDKADDHDRDAWDRADQHHESEAKRHDAAWAATPDMHRDAKRAHADAAYAHKEAARHGRGSVDTKARETFSSMAAKASTDASTAERAQKRKTAANAEHMNRFTHHNEQHRAHAAKASAYLADGRVTAAKVHQKARDAHEKARERVGQPEGEDFARDAHDASTAAKTYDKGLAFSDASAKENERLVDEKRKEHFAARDAENKARGEAAAAAANAEDGETNAQRRKRKSRQNAARRAAMTADTNADGEAFPEGRDESKSGPQGRGADSVGDGREPRDTVENPTGPRGSKGAGAAERRAERMSVREAAAASVEPRREGKGGMTADEFADLASDYGHTSSLKAAAAASVSPRTEGGRGKKGKPRRTKAASTRAWEALAGAEMHMSAPSASSSQRQRLPAEKHAEAAAQYMDMIAHLDEQRASKTDASVEHFTGQGNAALAERFTKQAQESRTSAAKRRKNAAHLREHGMPPHPDRFHKVPHNDARETLESLGGATAEAVRSGHWDDAAIAHAEAELPGVVEKMRAEGNPERSRVHPKAETLRALYQFQNHVKGLPDRAADPKA